MTGKVIQGLFLAGRPKLPPTPARLPPPIQPKAAARPPGPPAAAVFGRPPGPPVPAFGGRPPGPPTPSLVGRPGAVQRHGGGGAFAVEAGPLGLASGGGRPLPDGVRGKMEAALGANFADVRVYVGPQAERIGAIAFTIGSDIYFAPGRYQPDTVHGQQLLGHELAHVVQQRAGRVRNPLGSGLAVVQDHALEAEADRLGQRAAAHRVAAQAKMPPGASQPAAPVRISAPISAGPGSYRLTAGAGGRQVGSVMVHARDKASVEVTDLGVDPAHREHGIGKLLLASAARTGLQSGKSKMTLAAQDNGSGRLTQWYKGIGFTQVGVNQRGYPRLEAPIGRVLLGAAQPKLLGFQKGMIAQPAHSDESRSQSNSQPAARLGRDSVAPAATAHTKMAPAAVQRSAPVRVSTAIVAHPKRLAAQFSGHSSTLQRAQQGREYTDEELRDLFDYDASSLNDLKLNPADAEMFKELFAAHKKTESRQQKWTDALASVDKRSKLAIWQYNNEQYHLNTDHVTKEGNPKHHYYFVGTGKQLTSRRPTDSEAGRNNKTKHPFSDLPSDLQEFIKTYFTDLLS